MADAYKVKEFVVEKTPEQEGFKLVNSGTIDPYIAYWGSRRCRYIKGSYLYPIVPFSKLKEYSETRYQQAASKKIITASMTTRYEACLDLKGEYIAGKSTTIIIGQDDVLKFLTAVINSKLASFWLNIEFNSLKMSGGAINIGKNELQLLPIPPYTVDICPYVSEILNTKAQDPLADTTSIERKIDLLVYKLYRLTDDEIDIVESYYNYKSKR